jgi:PAS domain S-box-containing protein
MNTSQEKNSQLEAAIKELKSQLAATENKSTEENKALKKANEKLRTSIVEHEKLEHDIEQILEATSDGIRVIDKDYNIVYASKAFFQFEGHSDDAVGRKCYEAAPEKECFTDECSLKRILCTEKRFSIEKELKFKTGSIGLFHIDVIPYTDSNGEIAGIIKNYRNITEERKAEEKIRRISTIQNLLLENSTLGISLVRNRVFEWVNARVGELLMLPLEKIQGASTRIIYPSEESYKKLGSIAYPVLKSGKRSDNTLQLKRSDGSLFWCRFIGKAIDANNVQDGSVWMFEDITDKIQAQETAKKNAQQQGRIEMANNVLHDIGNAMTGISAHVLKPQMEGNWQEIQSLQQLYGLFVSSEQDLINAFGEKKQQALLDFMKALLASFEERHKKHLAFLEKMATAVGHVCSVLDLQRQYLREKSSPLATEINLPIMLNDTLVMMSSSLKKRNIQVSFDTGETPIKISADQTNLMRVFLNVIKNICEAFDNCEITDVRTLEITLDKDEVKNEVVLSFLDNAIGFVPEDADKFFERGFTSKDNGTGIGLHECRSIIEAHGGTMMMTSKGINLGALTTIRLPFLNKNKG